MTVRTELAKAVNVPTGRWSLQPEAGLRGRQQEPALSLGRVRPVLG